MKTITFIENTDGTFRSTSGWSIQPCDVSSEYNFEHTFNVLDENDNVVIHNKERQNIAVMDHDLQVNIEFFYRRRRHLPFQISPAHLPTGTVVRWGIMDCDQKTATVKCLTINGPGSYVAISEEKSTDLEKNKLFGTDEIAFNICHISEIVKRGNGQVIIRPKYSPKGWVEKKLNIRPPIHGDDRLHRLRKDEVLLTYGSNTYPVWRQFNDILTEEVCSGRFIDDAKLQKRLKQMGLLRTVDTGYGPLTILKLAKARKFVQKNPHWALLTMKESVTVDRSYWDDAGSDLDAY